MPSRAGTGRPRGIVAARSLLLLCAAVVLVALTGCGAPDYTYVKNSADRTYVKLPASWRPIDKRALDDAIGLDPALIDEQRGLWLQAYFRFAGKEKAAHIADVREATLGFIEGRTFFFFDWASSEIY